MLNKILNSQTKTITFAAVILSSSALVSRFLGLFRDGLLAGKFGAGPETDIYFAAFRIPDLVYNLLIAGGLSVAFLPIFSEHYAKNKKDAWEMTSCLINVFLLLSVGISLILFIFTPFLIRLIAPGFSVQNQNLAVVLTRLMFLSPIFFGLSSIFSGVLHYFNRFLIYSLAPILYNLGIIFGILFLAPYYGIFGVAIGVVLGALCHWLIQIPSVINCGFRYQPIFNLHNPALKKIFRLTAPRTLAMAGQQINLMVITAIASTLTAGSVAIFNFANNLYYFPIGLVGIPFAVAAFPELTRKWSNGEQGKFLENFSAVFRQILFLVIPASVLMFLLRAQLVRLVLGSLGSSFDWTDTKLTAACLGLFSLGIFAAALIPFLSRTFFSFQDTKTPTLISLAAVGLNIFLSFLFVRLLSQQNFFYNFLADFLKLEGMRDVSVIGLPFAFSLAVIFQFFLLMFFLEKIIVKKEIFLSLVKIIFATILSGIFTYFALRLGAVLFDTYTVLGIFSQTTLAGGVGIGIYLLVAFLLKSPELKILKSAILKEFKIS